MLLDLRSVVSDFAGAIEAADSLRPQALSARTGVPYQPGIGPHSESQAVKLVSAALQTSRPELYRDRVSIGVAYPGFPRQKCDLCLGVAPAWDWVIEVKLLRLKGDNGKPNDNMVMHILSPYAEHRSALTDCTKLVNSGFTCKRAIIIFGFDYHDLSMDPAIDAFELLAQSLCRLGPRHTGEYDGLVHSIHNRGRVFSWEVQPL